MFAKVFYLIGISLAGDWQNEGWAKTGPIPEVLEMAPIVLGLGEQRLVRAPGLLKFSLGNSVVKVISVPEVFGQKAVKDHLLIKGVEAGQGDLWVWKAEGTTEHRTIRVEKFAKSTFPPGLEKALAKLTEVEVIYSGFGSGAGSGVGVTLRGEITRQSECVVVADLLRNFPKAVFNATEIAPSLLLEGQARLDKWIRSSVFSTQLRVERLGQSLWLRGHVRSPAEQTVITQQAQLFFPLVQLEVDSLPDRAPTVYFRVFLLELKRNRYQSVGLSWPGSVPNALRVTAAGLQNLLQMDLSLQQLEGQGDVKILSNPELVVRAPGEAELFAGGQLPIQTQSRFFSNVTWKNYGLTLRLKITHVAGDLVRLEIFTEVSHLLKSASENSLPGIQSNRMKTQVDARFGSPLLLSGLLQQSTREEAKGIPFLRSIPVLGALFGSDDYLNERSELVAIPYPHSSPPETFNHPPLPHRIPRGPVPPPRNWVSPAEESLLRADPHFPWNVLD